MRAKGAKVRAICTKVRALCAKMTRKRQPADVIAARGKLWAGQ